MDDEGGIKLESLIPEAVSGKKEALDLLIVDCWTIKLLKTVSRWAERKFKQEQSEVSSVILLVLLTKITTIENPRHTPWCNCLRSFCYSAARNHCLNELDRQGRAIKNQKKSIAENTARRIKSSEGGTIVIQSSTALTPEEELMKKEREQQIRSALDKAIDLYPRDEEIAELWLRGYSVKEIADEIELSIKTVYPRLRRVQKVFFMELEMETKQ
jgi:RNA polymerase sigma factor (sigma-70 family)